MPFATLPHEARGRIPLNRPERLNAIDEKMPGSKR
jgi:enoyl-CoA hydratase/carnithine racemase